MKELAILPLARPTFDVEFANARFQEMLKMLGKLDYKITGPETLLFDLDTAKAEIDAIAKRAPDRVLILQVTFTDAAIAVLAAKTLDAPLSIWAVPEPRLGGRLRLNAFCGLNLASHALGRNDQSFGYLYANPEAPQLLSDLELLLAGKRDSQKLSAALPQATEQAQDQSRKERGKAIIDRLEGAKIARIGEHPQGFDTCDYEQQSLEDRFPVKITKRSLDDFFTAAKAAPADKVAALHDQTARYLKGMDELNQDELDKSLRLKLALDEWRKQEGFDAFAIRCWPETFTEYGGAVCGPVSMMGEAKVPCACEADVYGALSQLVLLKASDSPVFMVDMVDVDPKDDSVVVWHCGQAPKSMAQNDQPMVATIHTNRKMPLLMEFALKPGIVTFARLSRGHGELKLVICEGEMLERPMAFTGTSGVVRFGNSAPIFLENLINSGMEHHMALTYGSWRQDLYDFAAAMNLPVIDLSEKAYSA
ncbi:MAG: L-fucose/L-arabinose isomerase family protein [Alphaproteobacteria bacterium]